MDVVRRLHTHVHVHLDSKGFLYAELHLPGKISLAIDQTGQCRPREAQRHRRSRHRQRRGPTNFRPNEIPRMGLVLPGHGVDSFGQVVVLQEAVAFAAIQNQRSINVMERVGMNRDAEPFFYDFDVSGPRLRQHVLYKTQP